MFGKQFCTSTKNLTKEILFHEEEIATELQGLLPFLTSRHVLHKNICVRKSDYVISI